MASPTTLRAPVASEAAVGAPPARDGAGSARLGGAAVAAWVALVGLALWWGSAAISGRGLAVNAAPLVGHWVWRPQGSLVGPALVGLLVVLWGPLVAARLAWSQLVVVSGLSTVVWTTALAASDGWDALTRPLTTRHEYEPFAAGIGDPGEFLRTFLERLDGSPIHVQGHPPGAPLVPWALDAVGLPGAGWFAALVIAGWGVAVAAVLVAARSVAGEGAARRAAPAVVLLPAAIWAGTSADALFAGVLAVGATLAVVGRSSAGRERLAAVGGGAVLGLGLLLTYGGLAVVGIPAAVLLVRRRPVSAALVVLGVLGVLVTTALVSGFWWPDGLNATRSAYLDGVAAKRPGGYFALVGNPAALAVAVGPATAVGLTWALRRWRDAASLLPLVGLAVVVAVDASMLSKGEVERIWLPFVPWLALAAPGDRRGWLAVQAALALVVQAWLRSKW